MNTLVEDDFQTVEVVPLFGIPLEKLPTYQHAEPVGDAPTKKSEKLNVKLLLEIMEFIKAHPTTWHQEDWFKVVDRKTGNVKYVSETSEVEELNSCGTSFCFAGHVALAEGFPMPPKEDDVSWTRKVKGQYAEEDVETFAMARLGLNYGQSEALFGPDNSMVALDRMVTTLIAFPDIDGSDLEEVTWLGDDEDEKFIELLRRFGRYYNNL